MNTSRDVDSHLDDILAEVQKNPQLISSIISKLTHLIEAIPIAAKLGAIQQWNLLEGLLYEQSGIVFFKRMEEYKELKTKLAAFCLKRCGLSNAVDSFKSSSTLDINSIYFESGSTIAHLIGRFAEEVRIAQRELIDATQDENSAGDVMPPQMELIVNTNNLTALTALAGMIRAIEPTQGLLSLKYFGFLPFADEDKDANWSKEGKRYITLSGDVANSSVVFATCSSFSLIMGPLVGSRANALTKRAMYSGVESWGDNDRKSFYLLFHFNKYVPFASLFQGLAKVDPPEQHCCVVFARPDQKAHDAINKWKDDFGDSDPHPRIYDESWHGSGQQARQKPRQPIVKFHDSSRTHVLIPNELKTTWLGWCENLVRRDLRILIALPLIKDDAHLALEFLKDEIVQVNRLLAKGNYVFRYAIANPADARDTHVAEIEIRQGDGRPVG